MPPESSLPDEVRSYALVAAADLFEELFASARFEDLGKGRLGTTVVKCDETGGIPLVRTTTRYRTPAQHFQPVHERLARQIQERAELSVGFDNALVECYTNAYRTMGSHSDQALDLADGSFIAVFSCYRHPGVSQPRKLVFESKEPGADGFEIPLAHHGVVVFSVATNRLLRHRIVLDAAGPVPDNQWLGVTFRTSKTFVRFRDGDAYLPDGARLLLADEEQRAEFYRLRRRENQETDFAYPLLTYTVSGSDLVPPV
ncbi:hypothetical protein QEZ54_16725 [Catellatospora sp. KI3]|uniref:hypothetical protein n=1 Tax=Catellatospora sp. KI3 TaxID=3041620 RepID=UPI0024831260|nr:hypothetical protein [Catellatospora sp. KI3]MDI1462619.1 hypothetical protein [Catellatospora sp. KI3]